MYITVMLPMESCAFFVQIEMRFTIAGVGVHSVGVIYLLYFNKANLRDLIAATDLVFLPKIGFKSLIFLPM